MLLTGQTTSYGNIYDMGGNIGEFTTEIQPETREPLIIRGGAYQRGGTAAYKWDVTSDKKYGFRATLFLK